MSERVTKSIGHDQLDPELRPRAEVKRMGSITLFVILVTVLALLFLFPCTRRTNTRWYRLEESRFPTSWDMRIGLPSLPLIKTTY